MSSVSRAYTSFKVSMSLKIRQFSASLNDRDKRMQRYITLCDWMIIKIKRNECKHPIPSRHKLSRSASGSFLQVNDQSAAKRDRKISIIDNDRDVREPVAAIEKSHSQEARDSHVIVREVARVYLRKVLVLELLCDIRARNTRKDPDVAEEIQLQNSGSLREKLSKARSSPASNDICLPANLADDDESVLSKNSRNDANGRCVSRICANRWS